MIYLILLLGLLLRLISLNQSLWLDEATTALVAQMPITDFFTKFMPEDFHPPLYYLVVRGWWLVAGGSEVALRIPSVIFGLLTIYTVYLIAKASKFKWPLVPALFLATSGLHVYYSQEARMYGLATLLVSTLVYLFIKEKWRLFSIVLVLIFLTDYVSLIILPVLFLFNRSKKFVYATIPLIVTMLAWLPILSKQLLAGMAIKDSAWWNILGTVSLKNVALIPTKFMIGRVSFENKLLYAVIIIIISMIFVYVIGKAKNRLNWYWFALSLLFGIILSFFIPTLTYFRYLFVLPAFYLLLSEGTSKIFIVVVLVINILSTSFYLFNTRFQRENWRVASKVIGDQKIVFPANSQKEALTYYGKGDQIILSKELTASSNEHLWLSRYVWEIFDPKDDTRRMMEDLGYEKTREFNFNGVELWKYARRN